MILARLSLVVIFAAMMAAVLVQWHLSLGFDALDARWWVWLGQAAVHPAGLPSEILSAVYTAGIGSIVLMFLVVVTVTRARNRTVEGGRGRGDLHGSARWATGREVARAGLFAKNGVTVGGWKGRFGAVRALRHDGPEHVLVFAPTRSGKGVSLIVPTLLSWPESCFVLDIKGENHALSAGWREAQGHAVFRFDPAAPEGSACFNPLSAVRLGSGKDIADCQNIAAMIVDPDGRGLKDYWRQEGWSWLSVVILHVIHRTRREHKRCASLADVNLFAADVAAGKNGERNRREGGEAREDREAREDGFDALLDRMIAYEHGAAYVDREVRRGAGRMKIKAGPERSGVHSSAMTELALYADPIVAKNTATSDFTLHDLVNAERPLSLYMVIRPSDIDRLRPLVRIVMNLLVRRLTETLDNPHRHRLLLMLDEFTSIGKLEIFERALAFMAGYGLKAFVVVQDIAQLHQAYGRDEAILSNCHVRIAFAPNRIETAKLLSDMTGKATIVQARRSQSGRWGDIGSLSETIQEVSRPLLTADECMRLKGIRSDGRKVLPGEVLVFTAGAPPVRGRQTLYFQDRELKARAAMGAPERQAPDGQ